jgi:hypothetical protein
VKIAADGSVVRMARGGVCEWDWKIGNTPTITNGSSGDLELIPLNANMGFAVGRAGQTAINMRVRDGVMTVGSGIKFNSDTADVNMLDDYEEGNWDPTMTTDSGTITLAAGYVATYTKIGRTMTLTAIMTVSSVSSPSGAVSINNVPITMGTGQAAGSVWAHGLASSTNSSLQLRIVTGETRLRLQKHTGGDDSPMGADIEAGTEIVLAITFNIS